STPTISLTLDGKMVYTFAGPIEEAKSRAYAAAEALSDALTDGLLDYDFRVDDSLHGPRLVAHTKEILTVAEADAALAGEPPRAVAEAALRRLRGILWAKRVEAHI
ncbi:MAG TPA: hypothetical protein VEI97_09075, partial [bacterium]|nr:hypothetical protein [bacterium]